DYAASTIVLTEPLKRRFMRGTALLGRGFKLIIRLDARTEVFDNLSMSPIHPRYFVGVVNGPDEMLPYMQRHDLGYSTLIRVRHLLDEGGRSRFRPKTPRHSVLAKGGDGTHCGFATLKAPNNEDSVILVARICPPHPENFGGKGN